ncbi:alpha/beta fold hydrolase [Geodermatophilus sp. SYSU D00705]
MSTTCQDTAVPAHVEEGWIEAGGITTRYLEAGSRAAEPVVLLHDGTWGGASSVTWANVVADLAEEFHVLAPDTLGFGGTDKVVYVDRAQYGPRMRHLAAFLRAKQVERPAHLVGSSFGGSLALRILGERFLDLASVVSICGTGGPWRTALSRAELGRWAGTEADLRRIVDLLIDPTDRYEAQVAERLTWASDPGHYRALAAVSAPVPEPLVRNREDDGWPGRLAGATTPVLLVRGSRDPLLEPDWHERLTAVLPHAQVRTLDCKHAPQIDHPQLLMPVLTGFLRSCRHPGAGAGG